MQRMTKNDKALELKRQWAWICDALTSKQFFSAEKNWGLDYKSKIQAVRKVTKSAKVLRRLAYLEQTLNAPTSIELEVIEGGRLMTGVPRAKLTLVA